MIIDIGPKFYSKFASKFLKFASKFLRSLNFYILARIYFIFGMIIDTIPKFN